MTELKTIHISYVPMDCHILKGRLESNGIHCFIFDENMAWVHPLRTVAIGGVKLKVISTQFEYAKEVIELISQGKITDGETDFEMSEVFEEDINTQNKIAELKSRIRKQASQVDISKPDCLSQTEFDQLIDYEKEFQTLKNKKLNFTWKQFLYELFDFDRNVVNYFRLRNNNYYLEKDLIEKYENGSNSIVEYKCPHCESNNVSYGHAIDNKWRLLYLVLSIPFFFPPPLVRKKCHCFDCDKDFKTI